MTMRPPGFFAPRAMLERKPKHGAPCTRCGLCCAATLCDLARHVFGDRPGPCPALSFDKAESICGLAREPDKNASPQESELAAAAAVLIGSGTGCDARFNGEPPDLGFYLTLAKWDRDHEASIKQARKIWEINNADDSV